MKKQTFIAYIQNESGNMIDFERFTCKNPETVKKHMLKLFESELYRVCTKGAKTIDIYKTPDGYNKECFPVVSFELEF